MEPKDLIPTPDEERERVHNTLAARESNLVHKMASLVLENAGKFIEETFLKTAGHAGVGLYYNNQDRAFTWALKAGYESIQDGLKTIVKVKGRVIREMTADIEPRYAGVVARKVMEMIKNPPK